MSGTTWLPSEYLHRNLSRRRLQPSPMWPSSHTARSCPTTSKQPPQTRFGAGVGGSPTTSTGTFLPHSSDLDMEEEEEAFSTPLSSPLTSPRQRAAYVAQSEAHKLAGHETSPRPPLPQDGVCDLAKRFNEDFSIQSITAFSKGHPAPDMLVHHGTQSLIRHGLKQSRTQPESQTRAIFVHRPAHEGVFYVPPCMAMMIVESGHLCITFWAGSEPSAERGRKVGRALPLVQARL